MIELVAHKCRGFRDPLLFRHFLQPDSALLKVTQLSYRCLFDIYNGENHVFEFRMLGKLLQCRHEAMGAARILLDVISDMQ